MKVELNFGSDAFVVPASCAAHLDALSETDLRVLITLCSDKSLRADQDEVVKTLSERLYITYEQADRSVNVLRTLGALTGAGRAVRIPTMLKKQKKENKEPEEPQDTKIPQPSSVPEYSGEQIEALINDSPLYKTLIDQTQKILGTMFTPTEISRVIGLADYLKLEFDHILLIFTYCVGKGKKSVQYAVKTAYNLYNDGIDTKERFEEYIKSSDMLDDCTSRVRKIFGIHDRGFSAKEKEYISDWSQREIPDELISRAYEITVDNTGKASLAYCNKILVAWSDAGYKTLSDVEAAAQVYKQNKQNENSSFETNEFFEAALRRGREKMGDH